MNSKILQSKENLVNYINSELSQGMPPAVLALILDSIKHDLENAAMQLAEKEREEEFRQQEQQEQQNKEEVVVDDQNS